MIPLTIMTFFLLSYHIPLQNNVYYNATIEVQLDFQILKIHPLQAAFYYRLAT